MKNGMAAFPSRVGCWFLCGCAGAADTDSFPEETGIESDGSADSDGPADSEGSETGSLDSDTAASAPYCAITETWIECPHQDLGIPLFGEASDRRVFYAEPLGEPPADGWPYVLLFQGSYFPAENFWSAEPGVPWGGWYQALAVAALLDAGFAVITPETRYSGSTFWDTNVSPWNVAWTTSGDHSLMLEIFDRIEAGEFGALDTDQAFAAGLSSGGYMTSRMAVSYPGRFQALAIHSASYATCIGSLCALPALPEDHPPTLFLHGELDDIVPVWTMTAYADVLSEQGTAVEVSVDAESGHEWIAEDPQRLRDWFIAHGS